MDSPATQLNYFFSAIYIPGIHVLGLTRIFIWQAHATFLSALGVIVTEGEAPQRSSRNVLCETDFDGSERKYPERSASASGITREARRHETDWRSTHIVLSSCKCAVVPCTRLPSGGAAEGE